MANQIYRSFYKHLLSAGLGTNFTNVPEAPVSYYVYGVNATFGFNTNNTKITDISSSAIQLKSKAVTVTINDDGSLSFPPVIDLFQEQELSSIYGLVLVAEWDDGAPKSQLICYFDNWDQSVIPVNTTERVKLAFENSFLLRIGNVGPA